LNFLPDPHPARGGRGSRRGHGVRADERLVFVLKPAAVAAAVAGRLGDERCTAAGIVRLGRLDLGVEEDGEHFLPDDAAELLEHDVALVPVLDERVLLGHGAQVDALAQVVHVLEVLAPALVDDLEHDVALEVAHDPWRDLLERLLLRGVLVERVLGELLYERLA
jgi:hypothetical protein